MPPPGFRPPPPPGFIPQGYAPPPSGSPVIAPGSPSTAPNGMPMGLLHLSSYVLDLCLLLRLCDHPLEWW
ncbi:hypothetical protein BCR33DRAFT_696303 [Rhizoclosmatium globosum]|uniref:Uncharacterized protein n=1 Tax=Rhizoclosmatium globosum TaxID=329046 RepID=A0A1Y2CJX1_9FUNG|nr:hypothetical protein BCR33DRAFT_696303 [Rhizoclosmatium globosum]|eukprot:ORY47247.1 hypothetical protein BCR33DRAFT_696303 [Rhizoclosmatium globosum]